MINYKLLTPGPFTTTETVKKEMLVDHCTWDNDYKQITQHIRKELLRIGHASEENYTTVLMQGSGTFGVESVLTSAVGRVFIVDAMSSFGGIDIEVEKLGIDYIISSANKCIQGVPGFSFIICRKSELEKCEYEAFSPERKEFECQRVRQVYEVCGADYVISNMSELIPLIEKNRRIIKKSDIAKCNITLSFSSADVQSITSIFLEYFYMVIDLNPLRFVF